MSSFDEIPRFFLDQSPVFFHSFMLEGLVASELISFATSIKLDQAVRGATHCEVSVFQVDGVDKLEARNLFATHEERDDFVSRLREPDSAALANMGIRMSSHMGTIVHNVSTDQVERCPEHSSPRQSSEIVQPNKTQWPELKNTSSAEAVRIISGQRPDVKVMLIPQGSMVTMDIRMDRVRVFHDPATEIVTTIPKIG